MVQAMETVPLPGEEESAALSLCRDASEDEVRFAVWPTITVGTLGDVTAGCGPPGLVAIDITRRTALGNPLKMGPRGDAYHLAPIVSHGYSRLLEDNHLTPAAVAAGHDGVVVASGSYSHERREVEVRRLARMVYQGAKLLFVCCGLEDCHGVPLGRRVMALSALDPVEASDLRESHEAARPQRDESGEEARLRLLHTPERKAAPGTSPLHGAHHRRVVNNASATYLECVHGHVLVQGSAYEEGVMEPVCTIDACVRDAITWWALNKHTHGLVSGATAADVAAAAELLDSLPPPSATSGSAPTGLSIASSDPTDIARSRPSPQVRPSRTPPHDMGHHSASQHAQERGSYPTRSRAHGGHALRRKACPHRQRAAGREYRVGTRCLDRPWIRRRGPRGACPVSTWRQLGPGPGAPRVGSPADAPHHS